MPKRLCPFVGDLLPQHKIYVTDKELYNRGITMEGQRKQIYGKTMDLLFRGARNISNNNISKETLNPQEPSDIGHYKQLALTNQCQLNFRENVKKQPKLPCASCSNTSSVAFARCSFCEKPACEECIRKCSKCCEDFCRVCSLPLYGEIDTNVCLSCCR